MIRRNLFYASFILVAVACGGGGDSSDGSTSWIECETQEDCPAGLVCIELVCVTPEASVPLEAGVQDGGVSPGDGGGEDAGAAPADAGNSAAWSRRAMDPRSWLDGPWSAPAAAPPADDCDFGPRPDGIALAAPGASRVAQIAIDETHLTWSESEGPLCSPGGLIPSFPCDHEYAIRRAPRCGGPSETLLAPTVAEANTIENLQVAAYGDRVYAVLAELSYRDSSGTWTSLGVEERCVAALVATAGGVFVLDSCVGAILTAAHGENLLRDLQAGPNPMAPLAVNATEVFFRSGADIRAWALDGSGSRTFPATGEEPLFVAANDEALAISESMGGGLQRSTIRPFDGRPASTIDAPSQTSWGPLAFGANHAFLVAHGGGLHRASIDDGTPELIDPFEYQKVVAWGDRPYWVSAGRIRTPTAAATCEPPTDTAIWSYEYGPTDARIAFAATHPEGGVVLAGFAFGDSVGSVARLDPDGQVVWATGVDRQFGFCEPPCGCLAVSSDGGVLVGDTQEVTRLSPDGHVVWSRTNRGTCTLDAGGRSYFVESTASPGIFIRVLDAGGAEVASAAPTELAGLVAATTWLTQGPNGEGLLLAATESRDLSATVVARVNSDLSIAWTTRLDGVAARVRSTPSGGVIIVGTAEVAVSIDGQSWPVDRGPRSFAAWLSSDGTVDAVRILGSTTPADFVVTADGNVALATESCPLCSARRGTDFARFTVDRYSPAGELVGRAEIPGLAVLAADGTGVIAAGNREIVVGDPMGDGYIGIEAFASRFAF